MEKGKVYNHDVASLIQRLDRVGYEVYKSVSAGGSEVNQFDFDRVRNQYLPSLVSKIDWVVGQPLLDLPESHPREIDLAEEPVYEIVESESINDIIRLIQLTRIELVNSQSARTASGLIKFDEQRCRSVILKLSQFLDNFVANASPIDLPESSPAQPLSGPGRTGV